MAGTGLTKGFNLPKPTKYSGNADTFSISTWLSGALYDYLSKLVVTLESQLSTFQQQVKAQGKTEDVLVVTGVNFGASTITTSTLHFVNGIYTGKT